MLHQYVSYGENAPIQQPAGEYMAGEGTLSDNDSVSIAKYRTVHSGRRAGIADRERGVHLPV